MSYLQILLAASRNIFDYLDIPMCLTTNSSHEQRESPLVTTSFSRPLNLLAVILFVAEWYGNSSDEFSPDQTGVDQFRSIRTRL